MSDDPRDPSLETLMRVHRDMMFQSLQICQPGTIVSFNAATYSASVQLSIQTAEIDNETGARVVKPQTILNDVPVWCLGTNTVRIKLTLKAGDPVLVMWCNLSLDVWKQISGTTPVDPIDDTRCDYNECFCFPGRPSFKDISDDPAQIEFTSNTVNIGGTDKLVTKTDFDSHTHAVSTTGTAAAQTGTAAAPTPAVGTSKLRG